MTEKKSYCTIWPRKIITGFSNVSGNVWSAEFSFSKISKVTIGVPPVEQVEKASIAALTTGGDWFHDGELFYLYSVPDPDSISDNITIEFPIYLANKDYTSNSVPSDSTSSIVNWEGVLIDIPNVQNGSTETLYGISQLNAGSIRMVNADGFLNELLYDCSFNYSTVKAWIDEKQVFLGYCRGFELDEEDNIVFSTSDYMGFFDREYNFNFELPFNTVTFPNLDPLAASEQWKIRRVFGMVDGHVCVNIDYNATASTTVNRDWVSNRIPSSGTPGTIVQDLDNLGPNTATRTYFEDTPQVNVGDWVELVNNGTTYRVEVTAVNRVSKYIDHTSLTRTYAINDTCTRYFIARVIVTDQDNVSYYLRPGQDYSVFNSSGILGFTMADNWESSLSFTDTPFDPTKHNLFVRVYGDSDIDDYSDATDVSALVDNGGNRASALSHLFRAIKDSGFPIAEIDKTSFEDIGADSHSLGFAIPARYNDQTNQTYREIIEHVCSDMLWNLTFIEDSNEIKLGLFAYQPFISTADYEADKDDIRGFSYRVDYSDIYSHIALNYFEKENQSDLSESKIELISKVNTTAINLHKITKTYQKTSWHYDDTEADILGDRLSYALGDRRGIFNISLGQDYLDNTQLGVSYDIIRDKMPGFQYTEGVEQFRQTALIETRKSIDGVSLTLEDNKGIQDNSGSW